MKKLLLLSAISVVSVSSFAQPVIQDGSNIPTPGYSAPVSYASLSASGVGNAGANQTWDFSTLTFNPVSTMNIVTPSSAPMGSSFPAANHAYSNAGLYSFFNVSAVKMEVQAWSIAAAGGSNDYSPDPRTILKFPFNFNDSDTDTWQEVSGSPNTVTVTYDGYGTLITPAGTWNNVVRIRENYGAGQDDYQWFMLNPLMQVAIYDHNNSMLYHIAGTPNGIEENDFQLSMLAYPNPATDFIQVSNAPAGSTLNVVDVTGKIISSVMAIEGQPTTISTINFSNGVYFIETEKNGIIARRKFIVTR